MRAAIGLPVACASLDDSAAEALREAVLAAHGAIALRDGQEATQAWRRALALVADQAGAHDLLKGLAARLLLDAGDWNTERAATAMSLSLSAGAEPAHAAAWLEGFLNRNAVVLLHDAAVWSLVDDWLSGLGDEHFIRVLPLVRRTFSAFAATELRDLSQKARRKPGAVPAAAAGADGDDALAAWDAERAALPLPLLRTLLGLPDAARDGDTP